MGMEEAIPHDERYKAADEYMDLLYRYVALIRLRLEVLLTNCYTDFGNNHGKMEHRSGVQSLRWLMTHARFTELSLKVLTGTCISLGISN